MKLLAKLSIKFTAFALGAMVFTGCATSNQSANLQLNHTKTALNQKYSQTKIKTKQNQNSASTAKLSKYENTRIGGDCSGFVSVVNKNNNEIYFKPNELSKYFSSGRKSQAIFDLYKSKNQIDLKNAQVGDLVFFNNTTKGTKGGKKKLITHIGIITKVNSDGSVEFIHNMRGKNVTSKMDLNNPDAHAKNGKKINAYIISRCNSSACLVSNRFSGFGKISGKL